MTIYQVTLQRIMYGYATVEVEADTADKAEEMAPKIAMETVGPHDWDTPKAELLEDDLSVVDNTEAT